MKTRRRVESYSTREIIFAPCSAGDSPSGENKNQITGDTGSARAAMCWKMRALATW